MTSSKEATYYEVLAKDVADTFASGNPDCLHPDASPGDIVKYHYEKYIGDAWQDLPAAYINALYPNLALYGSQFEQIGNMLKLAREVLLENHANHKLSSIIQRFASNYYIITLQMRPTKAWTILGKFEDEQHLWKTTFVEPGDDEWERIHFGKPLISALTTIGATDEVGFAVGLWAVYSGLTLTPFLGKEFFTTEGALVLTKEDQKELLQPWNDFKKDLQAVGFIPSSELLLEAN